MPTYNQGHLIEESIDSVLSQQYPSLEFIIIDGGSSDNTVEVIKRYASKLTYWVSEKDNGQSHAINKGLKHCTGDLFNWLNSDDLLIPKALETIAEKYTEDPDNIHCIAGNIEIFGDENWVYNTPVIKDGSDEKTLYNITIKQPSTFYSMEAIRRMGPLNESLHYIMDYEWFIRFMLTHSVKNIAEVDETLSRFRLHNESKTGTNIAAFETHKFEFWTALWNWLKNDGPAPDVHTELYRNNSKIDGAISNYFYRQLVLIYPEGNNRKCRSLVRRIEKEWLDPYCRKDFNRMKTRSLVVPGFLRRKQ